MREDRRGRADQRRRCAWAQSGGSEGIRYHDEEWGVPEHRDRQLFELLILEGAQAGLSWWTILRKRAGYRRAFARFAIAKVARFDARRCERLMQDDDIVRNRLKIKSAVGNAKAALKAIRQWGSLDSFLWQFVDGRPIQRSLRNVKRHARTPASDAMSNALRAAGFTFVGSTLCYAFMQAAGMVNDHDRTCFRRREVRKLR
ncbi:MAG: DNA-3-methyladenine glycosylase I [Candidatus Eremiobacteraeota bacterium]|nr:DNA-3-methyladenine glycosylase I [Candidatus Eremiobacteraeota bacterium]